MFDYSRYRKKSGKSISKPGGKRYRSRESPSLQQNKQQVSPQKQNMASAQNALSMDKKVIFELIEQIDIKK